MSRFFKIMSNPKVKRSKPLLPKKGLVRRNTHEIKFSDRGATEGNISQEHMKS